MQRKLVLLVGMIAVGAILAVACSDEDEPSGPDHGDLLAALLTLGGVDLHHIEDVLVGQQPEIDPAWLAPLRNARTAVALVVWPEELQPQAEDFLADSMVLVEAIEADDLDAAAAAAAAAHEAGHLLEGPGYAYLAEQAGTGSMAAADDHDDGDAAEGSDDHDDDGS
jgi:hypothetical protein